ncbi:hypothetical protein C7974DRAFT_90487 [Boeremia exigua]|uniref:uncharacterized protein n=1 Tax=Boeremia exigua TaxID=749465 RepID=UPI001E8E7574|nr:uncharacterized protein C7974DRAFT_90487 [Boeremia exigua]KAH6612049.1 hypothetical protein C7974DRAFT_90487 [Boeremia exigua]
MSRQQEQSGREADMEAIDLTLSSPEPESRRQSRVNVYMQQQPQQSARPLKEEPRSSHRGMHSSNEPGQRQGSSRSRNIPQQPPRRINPQHVKQIIDTSSHRALRSVVLQLCKTSPALSGALVRGLAPHSPWAQALVRGRQAKSHTQTQSTVKTEPRIIEPRVHQPTNRQNGPSSSSHGSASQLRSNRPPDTTENRDALRLPRSTQKPPPVKHEHRSSPTDSDDSTNIVDFPAIERDARRQELSHHTTAHSSSIHRPAASSTTARSANRPHSTQEHAANLKQKLCLQCGELFKEHDIDYCYFHSGHEAPSRLDQIPQFTCCNRFVGEPGCKTGRHISERNGGSRNAKRPSPSSYSGSQWSKKYRNQ